MDQLITDALNYSKVAREELPLGPVDLGELLRGIVDTYLNLQPPAAEIHLDLGGLLVLGNESALTQVFGNLLGNAVKFVAPGIQPRVRVWAQDILREERPASHEDVPAGSDAKELLPGIPPNSPRLPARAANALVRIWVEDNGIGIPPEAHEKIFGMFQRMHGREEYPGTGIGLTIVRKTVERIGGQVGVESALGRGSRFWIELDRAEPRSLRQVA